MVKIRIFLPIFMTSSQFAKEIIGKKKKKLECLGIPKAMINVPFLLNSEISYLTLI